MLREGGDALQDRSVRHPRGTGNRCGRLKTEAPGEDRQAAKERSLLRRKQVIAPGDGVAHGLLTRRAGRGCRRSAGAGAAPDGPAVRPGTGRGSRPRPVRWPAATRRGGGRWRQWSRHCPASGQKVVRAVARSRKSATAGTCATSATDERWSLAGSGSGSSGTSRSPRRRRVLGSWPAPGAAGRGKQGRRSPRAASRTCSQLSSRSSSCFGGRERASP